MLIMGIKKINMAFMEIKIYFDLSIIIMIIGLRALR